MRTVIIMIGIVVLTATAATALAWSSIDRKAAPRTETSRFSPYDIMLKQGMQPFFPSEFWLVY
jgi:flagellar basal body-associated protein FliL